MGSELCMKGETDDLLRFSENVDSRCGCGCFAKIKGIEGKEGELPLTRSSYHIDIVNGLSEVTMVQEYQNFTEQFLEVAYKFPISYNVCLHKFSATFTSKRMEGRVKER